jgi:hypothetical protein
MKINWKNKKNLSILNRLKRNFDILNRLSITISSVIITVSVFEIIFYIELNRLFDIILCFLMIGVNILLANNNKKEQQ